MMARLMHELSSSVPERLRSIGPLLLIAGASELIYLLSFLRRFPLTAYFREDIDIGAITDHTDLAFMSFLSAFVALFILLAIAWWQAPNGQDGATLGVILACGGVFGVTLSFMYPITAVDVLMYVAHSRIMIHYHQNPIFVAPAQYPSDPI